MLYYKYFIISRILDIEKVSASHWFAIQYQVFPSGWWLEQNLMIQLAQFKNFPRILKDIYFSKYLVWIRKWRKSWSSSFNLFVREYFSSYKDDYFVSECSLDSLCTKIQFTHFFTLNVNFIMGFFRINDFHILYKFLYHPCSFFLTTSNF